MHTCGIWHRHNHSKHNACKRNEGVPLSDLKDRKSLVFLLFGIIVGVVYAAKAFILLVPCLPDQAKMSAIPLNFQRRRTVSVPHEGHASSLPPFHCSTSWAPCLRPHHLSPQQPLERLQACTRNHRRQMTCSLARADSRGPHESVLDSTLRIRKCVTSCKCRMKTKELTGDGVTCFSSG